MTGSFGLSDRMDEAQTKCLSCGAPLPAGREGQQKFTGGKMTVLVLGQNDDSTNQLMENVSKAIESQKRDIQPQLVTDETIINQYHIRKLPALIINGSIVSQGIVSAVSDIESELEFMY